MTEKDHSLINPGKSGEDALSMPGMKRDEGHDPEISGLKRGLEDRLRDLDSLKPAQAAKQTVSDGVDTAIGRSPGNQSRDNFERLLREGSKSSQAKNATQSNGCIPLLLAFSFIISLAFPLFWVVFVLILLGVLASSCREWMG
jgi:hypothetical protein